MNQDKTFLGTEPIGKLLRQLAIPTVIAQLVNMLYNIVDRIYIGHIPGDGDLALTGVGVCLPLILIVSAFAALVASGGAPRASIYMGKQDHDTAEKILGGCFALQLAVSAVLTAVLLLWSRDLLLAFGASENTIGYAASYMQIYAVGTVFVQLTLGLNAFITAQGFAKIGMRTVLIGAVANIILDPIFIFGFEWGIKGSAWATVISQVISLTGQMIHFSSPKQLLHFKKGIYKLRKEVVKGILYIGMSPFLMNLCSCLIVILINRGLKEHGGDMAIGAYGIVNRIIFLFVMIIMGFNQGMQPIAGYNFGARQLSRMIQVLKYTTLCAITVTTLGFLICQIFPRTIIRMFTGDSDLIDIAEHGMRLILLFFPLVGFQMVSSSFFQSIGMAGKAIFLSLTRQLIFLLPCLLILPHYWGTDGVWGSIPVADFIASITTGLMLGWQLKKFKTGGLNNAKDSVAL